MALRGGSAVDHFAILPPSAFGTCRACVGRFYFYLLVLMRAASATIVIVAAQTVIAVGLNVLIFSILVVTA